MSVLSDPWSFPKYCIYHRCWKFLGLGTDTALDDYGINIRNRECGLFLIPSQLFCNGCFRIFLAGGYIRTTVILIQLSLFSITTSWTLAYFWLLWLKMGMLWMWNMRERKKIFFSLYFYRSWDLIENDSLFLTYILHFLHNLCFLHDTFFPDLFLIFQILDHAFLHSLSIHYLPHNLFSSTFTLFCLQVFKLIIWCFILYTVE